MTLAAIRFPLLAHREVFRIGKFLGLIFSENTLKKSAQGNSVSSKNVPEFLKKYLTSASATSTNRYSDSEKIAPREPSTNEGPTYYRHFSKVSDYLKKDNKNKHSIVSNPNNDELGQYTYYCHEDAKGEKVEYRKSKFVHLHDNESASDGDSVTTPIASSQMKSEFRDKFDENGAKERAYLKIMSKCILLVLILI